MIYDFCLATDWEHDLDFSLLLERCLGSRGLSFRPVWPEELEAVAREVRSGSLGFRLVLDRASSSSPGYLGLCRLLAGAEARFVDRPEAILWASDKATMHLEFISGGIGVPQTVILAPFDESPDVELPEEELARLGRPFFVKPANTTGGGIGVFASGRGLADILSVRRQYQGDKYLVQERIDPLERDGRRFWFRGFHVCGSVLGTWWDDVTHLYAPLLPEEVERYGLDPLFGMVRRIAEVCRLRFFSTEIVLDRSGRWVAVDYVNETCDLRLRSRHADGVPDEVVAGIAERIAEFAAEGGATGSAR